MPRFPCSQHVVVNTIADRIVSLATSARSSWAIWRAPPESVAAGRTAAAIAADRLTALGLLIVRPGRASWATDGGRAAHRHVALLCADDRDRGAASHWVAHLSRASSRPHIVIDIAGVRARGGQRERELAVDPREVAAIDRHVDALDLDRADSAVGAIVLRATLEQRAVPAVIRARLAAVRFWQGRFDDTRAWPAGRDPDVGGWLGLHAWARGDPALRRRLVARLAAGSRCRDDSARFWRRAHAVLTAMERRRCVDTASERLTELAPG